MSKKLLKHTAKQQRARLSLTEAAIHSGVLIFGAGMSNLLTQAQVEQSMQTLAADPHNPWRIQDQGLHADWQFTDFQHAFAFMTVTAQIAEHMNHHPEWSNVYNRVSVRLSTHDAGGLTALDFSLAKAMTKISRQHDPLELTPPVSADQTLPAGLQQWVNAFNQEDLTAMMACYAEDAVLWGTRAPALINGQAGVRGYFQTVFESGRRVRVRIASQQLSAWPGIQISNGIYQFASVENGLPAVAEARFTFVWRTWADAPVLFAHHSSLMPVQAI